MVVLFKFAATVVSAQTDVGEPHTKNNKIENKPKDLKHLKACFFNMPLLQTHSHFVFIDISPDIK